MNHKYLTTALVAWSLTSTAISQEIYKCRVQHSPTKAETIYSSTPCGENAESVSDVLPDDNTIQGSSDDEAASRMLQQADIRKAAERGTVMVGMSADQVRYAWGRPTKINYGTSQRGTSDQWVYRNHGGRNRDSYVYISDGYVTSFDDGRPYRR